MQIQLIEKAISSNIPTMLWGAPGIGKTSIVQQIAKKKGLKLVTIRASLYEPMDFLGLPYIAKKSGKTHYAPSQLLPTEEKTLLFFDELPFASKEVQKCLMQLFLDRCLGEYQLPKDCIIVCAGNQSEYAGTESTLLLPLLNRCLQIEVEVNVEAWLDWATSEYFNQLILDFISENPSQLLVLPKDVALSFPTPRSWQFVNNLLIDNNIFTSRELICSAIGSVATDHFMSFVSTKNNTNASYSFNEIVKDLQANGCSSDKYNSLTVLQKLKFSVDFDERNTERVNFPESVMDHMKNSHKELSRLLDV